MIFKEKISNIFESTVVFSILEILSKAAIFLSGILIARSLGVEGYGEWVFFSTVYLYIVSIIDFGSQISAVRDLVKSKYNKNTILNSYITLRAMISLLCFLFLSLLIFFSNYEEKTLAILIIFASSFFFIQTDWHLKAEKKFFTLGLIGFIKNLVFIIYIIINFQNLDLFKIIFVYLFANISYSFLCFYLTAIKFTKDYRFNLKFPSKNIFLSNLFIFVGLLGSKLYTSSDIFIIKYYLSASDLGLYGVCILIYKILIALRANIITVLYPIFMDASFKEKKDLSKFFFFFGAFIGLIGYSLIYYFGDALLGFITSSQHNNETLRALKILGIGFLIMMSFFMIPIKIHDLGLSKEFMIVTLIAALINIIINIIYVPLYGIIAAAYSTIIAETVVFSSLGLLLLFRSRANKF